MAKKERNQSDSELIENSLFYNNLTAKELVIEASLRSSSLLELSSTINVDSNFILDLKSIYKKTRFSVDIESCILFRFVNGLWWEAMIIVEEHKFSKQCKWEKADKNQFKVIESLYKMRQDMSVSVGKNIHRSRLSTFLSQGNIHFEPFRSVQGGVAFKPSRDEFFTQYDKAFLTHVAAIMSFCIDKDVSSHYLDEVYQNIQGVANKVSEKSSDTSVTPAMYTSSHTGLHSKLGFLQNIQKIINNKQINSYIVIFSVEKAVGFIQFLDESVRQVFLQKVINRLNSIIPSNNTLSYIDAEEFAFIAVNTEESVVINMLTQAMEAFMGPLHVDGYRIQCELRVGYSCYSCNSNQAEELLKMASIALYQAKNSRLTKIIGYEENIVQELRFHLELSQLLSSAIDNNEFEVFFQPIVQSLQIGKTTDHFEALIRWIHPVKGIISPVAFINTAEQNGDIIKLGYWVIKQVCSYLSLVSVSDDVCVSVNLSPIQLEEPDLVEEIVSILNSYSIAPHRIIIEITESSAMQDHMLTQEKFAEFHSAGFKLSMDDFGTGYSSLSYLLNFHFDILKIDKSFLDNTLVDKKYEVIGRAVVELAHKLSLLVVCEGIETDDQLKMVRSWGTDMIQGFLIGKPQPWNKFF